MAAVWFWRRPGGSRYFAGSLYQHAWCRESPSFSPDGNEVAFVWDGEKQDNQDIYVKQVGMEAVSRFTSDPAAESSPAWSPDGRYIAFLRRISPGRVAVLLKPQRGGPEQKVTEIYLLTRLALTGPYLTWTPDGKNLIVVGAEDNRVRAGLLLLAVDSHELRRVLPPPERGAGDTNPAVSPDGKMLAFARVSQWGTAKIHVVELGPDFRAQGAARELTNGVMPAWTAGGAEILFSWPHHPNASRIWRIAASGRAVPRQLPGVGLGSFGPVISTREGRLLFCAARGSSEDVWKVALRADTPGAPARFIASSQSDQNAEYSPDGTRIVFASDRSGSLEIWTSNSDGSDPVKLTSFGGEVVQQPRWSPDGRKIAFHADVGGNREIFVISAAGGKPERLTIDPPWNANPRWSRDGHWIYFRSDRSGRTEGWKMPAGGGAAVQVTRDGGTGAQESADGRTLLLRKGPRYLANAGRGGSGGTGNRVAHRHPGVGGGSETPLLAMPEAGRGQRGSLLRLCGQVPAVTPFGARGSRIRREPFPRWRNSAVHAPGPGRLRPDASGKLPLIGPTGKPPRSTASATNFE